jgi:hypothetical protein
MSGIDSDWDAQSDPVMNDAGEEFDTSAPFTLETDFPVEALGPVLGPAAKAIQQLTQAPMALCGNSVLAAASLAVQAHADVLLPLGQSRPLSLFIFTIAESGERKSTTDRLALAAAWEYEAQLREAFETDITMYERDYLAWTKSQEAMVRKAKGDQEAIKSGHDALGPAPRRPRDPLLTAGDLTAEGLTKAFASGQSSMGLFTAEGALFTDGHAMTKENLRRSAAALNGFWDGEPVRRVRAGEGVTTLVGKRLSAHILIQPLAAMAFLGNPNLTDVGFVARFLVCYPDSTIGRRFWKDPQPEDRATVEVYKARLLALHNRRPTLRPDGERPLLPFSRPALRLWTRFYDEVERRLLDEGEFSGIRALASKAAEHAARIAGVLTIVDNDCPSEIGLVEMGKALLLMGFYLSQALRLTSTVNVDPDVSLAKRTHEWLLQRDVGSFKLSEVYQNGPSGVRKRSDAERIVSKMVELGLAKLLEGSVDKGGVWRVIH